MTMLERARQLLEQKQFEAAKELYHRYVQAHPGVWQGYLGLGQAYFQLRMFKEAIGQYQEVLRLAPTESGPAFYGIGETFYQMGRPWPAIEVWFDHAEAAYLKNNDQQGYDFVKQRRAQIETSLEVLGSVSSGSSAERPQDHA